GSTALHRAAGDPGAIPRRAWPDAASERAALDSAARQPAWPALPCRCRWPRACRRRRSAFARYVASQRCAARWRKRRFSGSCRAVHFGSVGIGLAGAQVLAGAARQPAIARMDLIQLVLLEFLEIEQRQVRALHCADELIQLDLDRLRVAVLGRLDEE